MKLKGTLRSGFVISDRVTVEVQLPEPDLTHHGDINRFIESHKGQQVRLTIEVI